MISSLLNYGAHIIYLDINKISPNPNQPRKFFDTQSLCCLCESIKTYGIIQPITVRKIVSGYELIAGERRIRAARMAGLLKVPAIIQYFNDDNAASIAVIENIQRENLSFIEESESYLSLMSTNGYTVSELAAKLGRDKSSIENKLRLLNLSELVREKIKVNKLSEHHAYALLKLNNEEIQLNTINIIIKEKYTGSQTDFLVESIIKEQQGAENKPVRKQVVKDVKIFVNTIKQAIIMIQKSGVDAKTSQTENEEYIEYIIKIAK